MDKKKLSNRALGRLLDPERPERGRRQVLRHLSGKHYPSRASRAAYGEILGPLPEMFDDDDEETHQVSLEEQLNALARDVSALSRRVKRAKESAA